MKKQFSSARTPVFLAFLLVSVSFAACKKTVPKDPDLGPYNLDASLSPVMSKTSGQGYGLVKFRQDPDTARVITLDTYVYGLQARHPYLLQRAVNPITDSSCSSIAWLTLGEGLVPQAIHTDGEGKGHELLFRDVTALARGTQFHIHFQILDSLTMAPVLASDCYEYTVR